MLKRLLINVLLKRGASAAEEALGKAVRHGLTVYGGVLLESGLASASDLEALIGGAMALLGIGISLARIKVQDRLR